MTVDLSRFNSPEAGRMGMGQPVGENDPEVQEQIRADEEAAAAAAAETTPPVETPAETPPVVPVETPAPVAVVPPPAVVPAEEEDDLFQKVDGGWEVRVRSLIPGGQDQVYRGRTKKEVTSKLAEGQANAQKRIHELDRAKRLKNILLEPEVLSPAPTFERRQLTADETYKLTNQLTDPAKAPSALRALMEAELGAPLETVRGALTRTSLEAEENRSRVIAREWVANNPSFYGSQENIQVMGDFFKERGWSVTTKNMDIAYSFLDASGALSDVPVEEEVHEPAAVTPAPAVTPAAPVTPAPTTSALPVTPAPVYRPAGPSSTGITRDSGGVRPASQPAGPVIPKVVLSVEEYRRTPMSEVRRRYRQDPAYRAAVDELIASNRI